MGNNEDLVHRLRDVALRYDRAIVRFGAANHLGSTDIRALIALLDLERAGVAATPGALAGALGLSSAACTALTDRLADAGLVRRSADPTDRRRVRLEVTAKARSLGESFFADLLTPLRAVAADLSSREASVVRRFLAAAKSEAASEISP